MTNTRECRVGDLYSIHSDNYGLLAYITVAKVNLLLPDDIFGFVDAYTHPSKAFSAYSIGANPDCYKDADDRTSQFAYFVSLPLDIANQDWWRKNPDCGYRQRIIRKPRHKTPPSHVTFKEYQKWLNNSLPGLEQYLTPEQVEEIAPRASSMTAAALHEICINPIQT